jgi:regulatory protein
MKKRITAIEPQKRNPQRVNIYLDGEFAFGLAAIVAGWLRVGQELDDEKIVQVKSQDEREATYQKALHFISFRPRSTMEVRQNLAKRGIPESRIIETLERLKKSGTLDDAAFASMWVENRNTFHPRGKTALRMELRQKGLSDEIIQRVLETQVNEDDLALEAARKYARRLTGLKWRDFYRKLGGFLARRGFTYTTFAPVISKVWEDSLTADTGSIIDNED